MPETKLIIEVNLVIAQEFAPRWSNPEYIFYNRYRLHKVTKYQELGTIPQFLKNVWWEQAKRKDTEEKSEQFAPLTESIIAGGLLL